MLMGQLRKTFYMYFCELPVAMILVPSYVFFLISEIDYQFYSEGF